MKHSGLALLCVLGVGAIGSCNSGPPSKTSPPEKAGEEAAPKSANPAGSAAEQTPAAGAHVAAATPADPARIRAAHADALQWIESAQQKDGSWNESAEGGRNAVGLTGLALLALQSDGNTMKSGAHAASIARGVQWLMSRQSSERGLIGEQVGYSFGYDHAIATQALCIALRGAPSEELHKAAQQAVNFIAQMRNPYGAWRYTFPPAGDNDTSITGWMVEALAAADAAGLTIDKQAYVGAKQWIDDVTDPASGRIGYGAIGSSSSRIMGLNEQFATDHHEAMTASGMVTRMNAGQTAAATPMIAKHADLLQRHLPEWGDNGSMVDEYYWYFGSLATKRLGGKSWETWSKAASAALLTGQDSSDSDKGSWKPVGPWGFSGGRVFSTSLNALSLATML